MLVTYSIVSSYSSCRFINFCISSHFLLRHWIWSEFIFFFSSFLLTFVCSLWPLNKNSIWSWTLSTHIVGDSLCCFPGVIFFSLFFSDWKSPSVFLLLTFPFSQGFSRAYCSMQSDKWNCLTGETEQWKYLSFEDLSCLSTEEGMGWGWGAPPPPPPCSAQRWSSIAMETLSFVLTTIVWVWVWVLSTAVANSGPITFKLQNISCLCRQDRLREGEGGKREGWERLI